MFLLVKSWHFDFVKDMDLNVVMRTLLLSSIATLLVGVTVLSPGNNFAFAADYASSQIGIVDLNRALRESKSGQHLRRELEKSRGAAAKKIEKQMKQFETARDKFLKQSSSLNDSARLQKNEELRQQKANLERTAANSSRALKIKEQAEIEGLVRNLRKIVSQLGKEKGYTLILEKGSTPVVLYGDKSVDITAQVIKKFDEQS